MSPKRAAAPAGPARTTTTTTPRITFNLRASKRVRGPDASSQPTARSPSPPLPFAELLRVPPPPPPLPPPMCTSGSIHAALAHLRAADSRLIPLIDAHGQRCAERLGGSGPDASSPSLPTFPRLVQTILAQQLSSKAAATIHRRLLAEAGLVAPQQPPQQQDEEDDGGGGSGGAGGCATTAAALRLTPGHVLALPEARVRSAGVSGAKAAALRDLALRFSDGRLSDAMLRRASVAAPEGLHAALLADKQQRRRPEAAAAAGGRRRAPCPAAEAAAALLAVRGVGPWSLDMASMFILGAPDVLPAGDLGVRKGLARLRGRGGGGGGGGPGGQGGAKKVVLPDAAAAERLTAPWRPYRSVGSWLMWRLAEEGS